MNYKSEYFTKFEIDFVNNFIKCLSHCTTYSDNVLKIIDDDQIKVKYLKNFHNSKNFFRITDKYIKVDNSFCWSSKSTEFQLSGDLLLEHKFYVFTEPNSEGNLDSALYLSPYLFNLIKKNL
jgi:hypothetical protein